MNIYWFVGLLILMNQAYALDEVAKVELVKGIVHLDDRKVTVNQSIREGQTMKSEERSMARLRFFSGATLTLGANSEIKVSTLNDNESVNGVELLVGRIRAQVENQQNDLEKFKVKGTTYSLGVRGTDFYVHKLSVENGGFTEAGLLEGKVDLTLENGEVFQLRPGEIVKIEDLYTLGKEAIKKLPQNVIDKLRDNPISTPNASLFGIATSASLALASKLPGLASKEDKEEEIEKVAVVGEQAGNVEKVKSKEFQYDLKNEPPDIRDAVLGYSENSSKNICSYFFYKRIPGRGELERFKRERKCQNFDFDL